MNVLANHVNSISGVNVDVDGGMFRFTKTRELLERFE